jgi:hypothetical protein
MFQARRFICATGVATVCCLTLLAQEPSGPPAFVTFPILTHVAENGLDHGHFVEGPGESAIPAPIFKAPAPGTAAGAVFSGTVGASRDANVSLADGSYEGETGAVSNGTRLVGGSNHIYPGNCSAAAAPGTTGDCAPLAYSSLDGVNFLKSSMSRVWNGTTFGIGFDPGLDVDKNGNFYFSYGVAPLGRSFPNAVVMMTSPDGINWQGLTPITFNTRRDFDDKYYLAIDRSATSTANRIYVSWDRNSGNNQILLIASSSDGGHTWTAPIKVNDGTSKFERVIGAYPAVNQTTGVVYDSWHDYAKNIIFVDRSLNGGATWGTDVAAATTHAGFGADIGCVGGRSQGPAHALKVGPSGALYLVYADPVQGRGFDVLLTKSTNGGASWSAPLRLNDDAGAADQFHPTLSVEAGGTPGAPADKVTVSFYDRRDDPANCAAHVYATQSANGGATWSANVKLTTASSNFDGNPNGPGDYSSSSPFARLSAVFPFFSDHRTADFEIFTAAIASK